jgi:hypothetical protein
MEAIRELRSSQYSGPSLELIAELAQVAIDLSNEELNEANAHYQGQAFRAGQGIGDGEQLQATRAQLAQAELNRRKAMAQQQQLQLAIARHHESDAIAKHHIETLKEYIAKRKSRLLVTAPVAGKVRLVLTERSFAELGTVVLTIS